MEQLIMIAGQYGPAGLFALAAGWYVVQHDRACNTAHKEMQDRHSEERKEMTSIIERQHAEAMNMQKETNEVMRGVTNAVSELTAVVRDRRPS